VVKYNIFKSRKGCSFLANVEFHQNKIFCRLWGDHGQRKLENAKVCLVNATALGTEILKNLILPGMLKYDASFAKLGVFETSRMSFSTLAYTDTDQSCKPLILFERHKIQETYCIDCFLSCVIAEKLDAPFRILAKSLADLSHNE
jgi:hypothetical protein